MFVFFGLSLRKFLVKPLPLIRTCSTGEAPFQLPIGPCLEFANLVLAKKKSAPMLLAVIVNWTG